MRSVITFRRLAYCALVLAFCVVVFGAFVRLSDAGLGCPDWPGCYGHISVPQSETALARAMEKFPDSVVEARKAWIEMIHRYLAGILGALVLVIAVLAWRWRSALKQSPGLPTFLVGLIVVQAAFGMWTVTLKLMPLIVTLHLLGGMTTLALLAWLVARQHAPEPNRFHSNEISKYPRMAKIALAILAIQVFLGGWVSTNYAGMACPDFPLCHGTLVPSMEFGHGFSFWRELGVTAHGTPLSNESLHAIQWMHRVWALITLLVLIGLGVAAQRYGGLRTLGIVVLILAIVQVSLGIANVWYVLPLPLAVAHNAGAALLLVTVVMINFRAGSAIRLEK